MGAPVERRRCVSLACERPAEGGGIGPIHEPGGVGYTFANSGVGFPVPVVIISP
jgi:hypothetical protein